MREIEFRAWDKKRKKMVNVYTLIIGNEKISYEVKEIFGNYAANYLQTIDIEQCELMQYTGVRDKNGVKIFECDIVKFDNKLYKVIWDNDECRFGLTNNVENTLLLLTSWRMQKLEVIGNIYENPELLNE